MSYLLDSQVLLWMRADRKKLSPEVLELLGDTSKRIYYSVITPWELSIKAMKGKLALPKEFFTTLPHLGLECLTIEESHVEALRTLPPQHHDPFDRMLVAQAKNERLTLITRDRSLAAYPIQTLLA